MSATGPKLQGRDRLQSATTGRSSVLQNSAKMRALVQEDQMNVEFNTQEFVLRSLKTRIDEPALYSMSIVGK
jgi:hypothetical protein